MRRRPMPMDFWCTQFTAQLHVCALLADIAFVVIALMQSNATRCFSRFPSFVSPEPSGVFRLRPKDTATKIFSAWRCRAYGGLVDARDARLEIRQRRSNTLQHSTKLRMKLV
jgi:hypothetical protein